MHWQPESVAFVVLLVAAVFALPKLFVAYSRWQLQRELPASLGASKIRIEDGLAWYETFPLRLADRTQEVLEAGSYQTVLDVNGHAIVTVHMPQAVWVVISHDQNGKPKSINGFLDPARTDIDRLADVMRKRDR